MSKIEKIVLYNVKTAVLDAQNKSITRNINDNTESIYFPNKLISKYFFYNLTI